MIDKVKILNYVYRYMQSTINLYDFLHLPLVNLTNK